MHIQNIKQVGECIYTKYYSKKLKCQVHPFLALHLQYIRVTFTRYQWHFMSLKSTNRLWSCVMISEDNCFFILFYWRWYFRVLFAILSGGKTGSALETVSVFAVAVVSGMPFFVQVNAQSAILKGSWTGFKSKLRLTCDFRLILTFKNIKMIK